MTDDRLLAVFAAQHAASRAQPEVPLALRRDRLQRLRALIDRRAEAWAAAVQADFGVRSPQLTEVADLLVLRATVADALRHLARWSRPQRVRTPLQLMPARGWVQRQPLGVVGVISPWNYPLQLALGPAASALAAGNRVMLKPSELTPRTSAALAEDIAGAFAEDEFCVLTGDAERAAAFAALPFDHLFFTGSTGVGRKVAAAAAQNLTPTTLELGGKSPCIVDASCTDLDGVASKIAHGKLLNAGQTCIAPDYLLVPRGREAAFVDAFSRAAQALFPHFDTNPDYAALIGERHRRRLDGLVAQAVAEGATAHSLPGGDARQMAPVLLTGVTPGMAVMQEEIFGPVLPVLGCDGTDEAVAFINARPRPLALYWFGTDTAARDAVLARTVSGGVTVNDTLMHIAHEGLPFGGVGPSGWGASHGEAGFLRFTHEKAVLVQSRWSAGRLLYPPYGARFDRMMRLLRRLG
ncbi:MAG: aldehyde dehydrogenase family protein [Proteobacteria bacterium]|nr:aldehyde dehydrogenase family protein [Pseudomonadota bacterium]